MAEVLRFRVIGGIPVKVPVDKVKEIITTELSNSFHYQFSEVVTKEEVLMFLNNVADNKTLKKIAYYVLFYTENLVFSVYLLILAREGLKRAEEYLKEHKELLEKLREIYKEVKTAPSHDQVQKMLDLCLNYAIDPF